MVPILPFGADCCALRERGGEGPEDATLASVHPGRLQKFLCMVGLGRSRPLHSTISLWLGILNANATSQEVYAASTSSASGREHARQSQRQRQLHLLPQGNDLIHSSVRDRDRHSHAALWRQSQRLIICAYCSLRHIGAASPPRHLSRFESDLRWSADSLGDGSGVGWRRDAPVRPHAYLCEIGKTSRASKVGGRTTTATRWKSAREGGREISG